MKIEQRRWTAASGWKFQSGQTPLKSVQLVLAFGATGVLERPDCFNSLKEYYPTACIFGCSTAGEICGTQVTDDSLVVTAVSFEHTQLQNARIKLSEVTSSFEAGERLALALPPTVPATEPGPVEKLKHVLVLSDGSKVNGSDLVKGISEHLPEGVTVTGGLAGDGARFGKTLVFPGGAPESDAIAVLGLYGNRLHIGFGSQGGWDSFGPERLITRSKGNVLYEMDGHSALGLYKKYMGDQAAGLPATGLLFPLSLRTGAGGAAVVRTILSVDEQEQSVTFAGDVPEGAFARLMKSNSDRLIDGATSAARTSFQAIGTISPDLAILISCVGRKLVLKQRVEEEVEVVREVLGDRTVLTGFYSYGEISPFAPGAPCELHNQTMTITTLSES
jgi:hypothetical protein